MQKRFILREWLAFFLALAFFTLTHERVQLISFSNPYYFFLAAIIPLIISFPVISVLAEVAIIPLLWVILDNYTSPSGPLWLLPVVGAVLPLLAYRLNSRIAALMTVGIIVMWIDPVLLVQGGLPHWAKLFFLISVGFSSLFFLVATLRGRFKPLQSVDAIISSYSGNSAYLADQFLNKLKEEGVEVKEHRFHYFHDWKANFEADALVIAFPIYCFSIPWALLNFLIKELPRGRGKPAYILYTAAGLPENSALLAWLVLTLKGYRVVGRMWSISPVNMVLLRPGFKRMWDKLDKAYPLFGDHQLAREAATQFARGRLGGLCFHHYPAPLWALMPLFYNKWLCRTYVYNYVRKKRCTKCNICVQVCPAERISDGVNGFPKGQGDCLICYNCVNLCPTNAMQLAGMSEMGVPYRPRWRRFVVRKKKERTKLDLHKRDR